jgi:chaperonin cofactor prefoldin
MTQISRYSLTLIVAAAIIIEVLGAAQYFMARSGARNELLAKAQRDMQESQRVAMVKTEVETALKNAEHSIHLTLGTPETSYSIAARIIQVNPHIIGVGVAFIPNYYKDKGRHGLFLPYTYDDQPSIASKGKRTGKPHIRTHIPSLDYTQRDWYKTAMAGQRQWTEAYVGEGGLNVLMCTYSIPVTDKSGRTVGVLFADVTMEDATVMMSKLNHGIRKSAIATMGIQIVSFLLLSFIIWRSVVASRRYKARYIDPEKNHLIEQVEKMRQVNTRLTKRNQELAQRVAEMQARLNSQVQQRTDQHWFG